MPVRILFIGDMHLGRAAARLPDDPAGIRHAPENLGPVAAWQAAVEWALDQRVDAVALAGDVCDSSNDLFEAYAALKSGAERLAEVDIPVFAVAGNHDGRTLPRLVEEVPSVKLLGRDGTWSSVTVKGPDGGEVELVGWSFPDTHWAKSPLETSPGQRTGRLPRLGLLHCDLEKADSDYAPVRRSELAATDIDRWFLGHIHKPDLLSADGQPGYLGSLSGLDPSETGRHGPWLVEVAGANAITCRQLPLAPLRWERLVLALDETHDDLDAVKLALLRARSERIGQLRDAGELDATQALGFRLELEGTFGDLAGLDRLVDGWIGDGLAYSEEDLPTFLDRTIDNRIRVRLDLESLAAGTDPPALLARKLVSLRAVDETGRRLLADARTALAKEAMKRQFKSLPEQALDDEEIRGLLLSTGQRALEHLLRQREERL